MDRDSFYFVQLAFVLTVVTCSAMQIILISHELINGAVPDTFVASKNIDLCLYTVLYVYSLVKLRFFLNDQTQTNN